MKTTMLGRNFVLMCVALALAGCGSDSSPPNPPLVKLVALNGAQENPAVTTAAVGSGFFSVDPSTGGISGSITTFAITATAAHIHEGAVGVNGPIIVPLVQTTPGAWAAPEGATLTSTQVESFRTGNLYVNVHTSANPTGETRGQIGRQVWFASLTASQENPPTTSTASGTGRFVYDPDTRTLAGTVTTTGVPATAGHVHTGAIGTNGPVTIPFTGGPNDWVMPSRLLTDAEAASLQGNNFYANVHSVAFPGGEIRGQLYLPAKAATPTGAQEVPANASTATGRGWFVVNPYTRNAAGRLEWSGVTASDAHIHRAAQGVSGGIVVRGTVAPGSLTISTTAPIADDILIAFMQGNLYYNVHSAAFPAGEIRGQLVSGQ